MKSAREIFNDCCNEIAKSLAEDGLHYRPSSYSRTQQRLLLACLTARCRGHGNLVHSNMCVVSERQTTRRNCWKDLLMSRRVEQQNFEKYFGAIGQMELPKRGNPKF